MLLLVSRPSPAPPPSLLPHRDIVDNVGDNDAMRYVCTLLWRGQIPGQAIGTQQRSSSLFRRAGGGGVFFIFVILVCRSLNSYEHADQLDGLFRCVQLAGSTMVQKTVGLGTGTVRTGSSTLLMDLASIFAGNLYLAYAQETRHIIVWKPTKYVSGGESREKKLCAAASQYTDWF